MSHLPSSPHIHLNFASSKLNCWKITMRSSNDFSNVGEVYISFYDRGRFHLSIIEGQIKWMATEAPPQPSTPPPILLSPSVPRSDSWPMPRWHSSKTDPLLRTQVWAEQTTVWTFLQDCGKKVPVETLQSTLWGAASPSGQWPHAWPH